MGLLKNILMGGAIGAYYKGQHASQVWDGPENKSRMHTMFPPPETQGYGYWDAKAKNEYDKAHKEVMRRRFMKGERFTGAVEGAAVGALPTVAAALGAYGASRRRLGPRDVPARMPHPAMPGMGVGGGVAAPAA